MKTIATLLFLAALPAAAHAETIAIVGATVHTAPGKTIDGATVVIAKGKITAVGKNVTVPEGATRIDGEGKVVTAGLVDSISQLGLVTVQLEPSGNDQLHGAAPDGDPIHAAYRAIDGYDADALTVPVARTGGVTSVVVTPSGGLVAGQAAWFTLADGVDADDAVRATAAMHCALGEDASGASGGSRGRAIEMLRELFDDVAAYAKNKAAYERNQSRELSAARSDLEALIPVLRGRVPLVVHAHAEHDIRAALRLAAARKLDLVIAGGTEAWKVAEELAEAKVPVILDPTDNLPGRLEAPDVVDDNAARLDQAGVEVVISVLGDASQVRTLRQLAGNAVAEGLSWDKALAAVTTVPARLYGIKDRGTITKGAVADVVVWSGDPFELSTRAETVIIGGAVQSLETHQTKLREKYRKTGR